MKRWSLIAIGLGVYALALIATAPATLVDAGLQHASDGRLRLAEAKGTLWSGTGLLEVRDKTGQNGIAKNFAWRIVPQSLLRGHLVYEIGLGQATRRFPVTISLSRIELTNADISLPAAALGLAVPKLAPLELSGEVQLHIARLSIERSAMRGNATLQWRDAGSGLSPVSPLGDYELRIGSEGALLRTTLRTLQGPLQLDGGGSWMIGARPALSITARVLPAQRQLLAPLLRLIAVERSDGSFDMPLQ